MLRLLVQPDDGHGWLHARVRDVAREQRALLLQQRKDVATKGFVGLEPRGDRGMGLGITCFGNHGRHVAGRPDEGDGLHEGALVLDGSGQPGGIVGRAQPAPQDEVGARGDRRGGVDLQQGQPVDDVDEVAGARCVEQLRVDRDPARFVLRQAVGNHRPTIAPSLDPDPEFVRARCRFRGSAVRPRGERVREGPGTPSRSTP